MYPWSSAVSISMDIELSGVIALSLAELIPVLKLVPKLGLGPVETAWGA